jgi:hypothetical protein
MQEVATRCKKKRKVQNLWQYLPMDLVLRSLASPRVSLTELAERSRTCKQFRDVYEKRFAAVEKQLEDAALSAFDSRLVELVLLWLSTSGDGHRQAVEFDLTQGGDWPDLQELLAHRRVKLSVSAGQPEISGQERSVYSVLLNHTPKEVELRGLFGQLSWYRAPSGSSRGPHLGISWSCLIVHRGQPRDDPGLRSVGCPLRAAPALGLLLLDMKRAAAASSDKLRRLRPLGLSDLLCTVYDQTKEEREYTWRDAGVAPEHIVWALDASWVVARHCRGCAFSCTLIWYGSRG